MSGYENQINIIKKHFENITEEELNRNLEKCGINDVKYNIIITMVIEEISNLEMNIFIQKNYSPKEEIEWKMEQNQQVHAA